MHIATEIISVDQKKFKESELTPAGRAIQAGLVVAFPTDTFYGLGADPFNLAAVERVYQIKGRPRSKPLLLLIDNVEQATMLTAELPDAFQELRPGVLAGAPDHRHACLAPPSPQGDRRER